MASPRKSRSRSPSPRTKYTRSILGRPKYRSSDYDKLKIGSIIGEDIGEGRYGKVIKVSPTEILKIANLTSDENGNIEFVQDNVSETSFLRSFPPSKHYPIIPYLYDVDIKKDKFIDKLYLLENYTGKDLYTLSQEMDMDNKIRLAPEILIQMARILIWMKDHCASHMDIQPRNMTLDENNFLTLIDWGFFSPVFKNSSTYHGTQAFGDSTYFNYTKHPTYAYDLLGMALTLLYFISGKFTEFERPLSEKEYIKILDLPRKRAEVVKILGVDYGNAFFDLLEKMLRYNEKNTSYLSMVSSRFDNSRITAEEVYDDPILDAYRDKYPLLPIHPEKRIPPFDFSKHDLSSDNPMQILIITLEWLFDTAIGLKIPFAYHLGLQIFYKYVDKLDRDELTIKNIQEIAISSLYLASILLRHEITSKDAAYVTAKATTSKKIQNRVIDILKRLEWDVYPPNCLPDYEINYKNFKKDSSNYNKYKSLYFQRDDNGNLTITDFVTVSPSEQLKRIQDAGFTITKFYTN